MLAVPMLDVLPLLRVGQLLHAHQTDKMHTDVENRDLVNSFSTFFVSKITDICRGAPDAETEALVWPCQLKAPMNNQMSTN